MKISELKNPPQWLLNATTKDEDVDVVHRHSGVWIKGFGKTELGMLELGLMPIKTPKKGVE